MEERTLPGLAPLRCSQKKRHANLRDWHSKPPISKQAAPLEQLHLTHPDKIYWPDIGLTKQGLADYYQAIWPWIGPHVRDRPLAFLRCPDGVTGQAFFQKHRWAGLDPARVTTQRLGGDDVLALHDVGGLTALAQGAVLEIHPWGSTLTDPEHPDHIILDLDPGEGVEWASIERAAVELRQRLAELGLVSFLKTSGGKGLHVVLPIEPTSAWDEARTFAHHLAERMAREAPEHYTANMAKAERTGRIFIDYLRNGRGATAVAPYSPRARAGAPVSTPLDWAELGTGLHPAQFSVATILRRLDALPRDPWADYAKTRQSLPKDRPDEGERALKPKGVARPRSPRAKTGTPRSR